MFVDRNPMRVTLMITNVANQRNNAIQGKVIIEVNIRFYNHNIYTGSILNKRYNVFSYYLYISRS
jgi:hypothetical protein